MNVRQIIEKTGLPSIKHTVHDLCNKRGLIQTINNKNPPGYGLTNKGRDVIAMRTADNVAARVIKAMPPIKPSVPVRTPVPRPAAVAVITAETKITLADASPVAQRPHYDGAELRPFEGRPGSMRAFGLPSRGIGA